MPFRSVEFGDSVINTKSVLTTQSPWWCQLKTASFRVGTSHAAAFFFPPLFFSRQFCSVQLWPLHCCAPVPCSSPRARLLLVVGKHHNFHSFCPIAVPLSSPSVRLAVSNEIWVQYLFVLSHRDGQYCLYCPSRNPVVSLCCHHRPFDEFHGKTPAYQHDLFIPVSIPSIPWMSQVKSWIIHKVSRVKSYLHAKVVLDYPEVKCVQTPSVRTLLN